MGRKRRGKRFRLKDKEDIEKFGILNFVNPAKKELKNFRKYRLSNQ